MLSEEQSLPGQRYLHGYFSISTTGINSWKSKCMPPGRDQEKIQAYEKYMKWEMQENEIAVFTSYAYADFTIPKQFDIIFHTADPLNFVQMGYELTQSIFNGWFPINSIEHGHKHICVFRFPDKVPAIIKLLPKESSFDFNSKKRNDLGFCHSRDFNSISAAIR